MISVTPATQPLAPEHLDTPGGFAWWYLDLVGPDGDGLVLIWSFGLPFLPGQASAERRRRAAPARRRPSLNIATYRAGNADLYLLQEYSEHDVSWTPETDIWRFGDTTIQRDLADGQLTLKVQLDCAMPAARDRLTGTVTVQGPVRHDLDTPHATEPVHDWSPVAVGAHGHATLHMGSDPVLDVTGRAYHDRNGSSRALHRLGINRWSWGRMSFPDGDVSWYLLHPDSRGPLRALVCETDLDGRTRWHEDVPVTRSAWRGSIWGLHWYDRLRLGGPDHAMRPLDVRLGKAVDDGPFYLRWLPSGERDGAKGFGTAEEVVPGRIDLPWMAPLVRMRVHSLPDRNSMWLPLFSGPRAGRLRRLLQPTGPSARQLTAQARP